MVFLAVTFIGDQVDQQNNHKIRSVTYMIQFSNLILQFSGLSLAQDFQTYDRYFKYTITNFNKCTDPSKLNREPERVKIVTVASNG